MGFRTASALAVLLLSSVVSADLSHAHLHRRHKNGLSSNSTQPSHSIAIGAVVETKTGSDGVATVMETVTNVVYETVTVEPSEETSSANLLAASEDKDKKGGCGGVITLSHKPSHTRASRTRKSKTSSSMTTSESSSTTTTVSTTTSLSTTTTAPTTTSSSTTTTFSTSTTELVNAPAIKAAVVETSAPAPPAPAPPASVTTTTTTSPPAPPAPAPTPAAPQPQIQAASVSPAAAASGSTSDDGAGCVYNDAGACGSMNVKWAWNWAASPGNLKSGVNFCPTCWGEKTSGTCTAEAIKSLQNVSPANRVIIGFNEPERGDQSGMTPQNAASLWHVVTDVTKATGAKIVGPGVASEGAAGRSGFKGIDWLVDFDNALKASGQQSWDFTNLHLYADCSSADAIKFGLSYFQKYVEAASSAFGRPIWVTEIGCNDVNNLAQNQAMINMFVPAIKAMPQVVKYSWFKADFLQGIQSYN